MAVALKMITVLNVINPGGTVDVAATAPLARSCAPSGLWARPRKMRAEHPARSPGSTADLPTRDEQTEIASNWVAQVFDLARLCDRTFA
jgi:hypothetical protein